MNTENENGANNEVNSETSATPAPETTSTPETVAATSAPEAVTSSTAETVSPEVSTEVNSNASAEATDTIEVTFSGAVSGTAKVPRGTALKDAVKAINGKLTGVTFRSAANAVLTQASKLMEAATISTIAKTSMG